jgi:hypothetical protein
LNTAAFNTSHYQNKVKKIERNSSRATSMFDRTRNTNEYEKYNSYGDNYNTVNNDRLKKANGYYGSSKVSPQAS